MVCRSEFSEVLRAESPSHTPIQRVGEIKRSKLLFRKIISSEHVSCKVHKYGVDTHLCKLRDTPAARVAFHGHSRVQSLSSIVTGTSSAFVLASIWGPIIILDFSIPY